MPTEHHYPTKHVQENNKYRSQANSQIYGQRMMAKSRNKTTTAMSQSHRWEWEWLLNSRTPIAAARGCIAGAEGATAEGAIAGCNPALDSGANTRCVAERGDRLRYCDHLLVAERARLGECLREPVSTEIDSERRS